MEELIYEIKSALLKQPSWVFEKTFQNISKFSNKSLVSKYESKKIVPLTSSEVIDIENITQKEKLEFKNIGEECLRNSEFAYFIMVGGVATSMGGCIKALVIAKENKTFIEIKLDHVRSIQNKYNCKIPVILMTNEETDKTIMNFLHSKKLLEDIELIKIVQPVTIRFTENSNGIYVAKDKNGKISYVPGGHYDSFLLLNEMKNELDSRGIKTILINNIDNLGVTIDPIILGCHIKQESLFTPEVARKEKNEKGGVFANIDGKLRLLEGPMVPEDYVDTYNDSEVHKYFNTNNIYLETSIFEYFDEIDNEIPSFINKKEFEGIKMFGFESAIGLVFGIKKSSIIAIDRSKRFCPVKFLSDLWLVRSNFYLYDKEMSQISQIKKQKPTIIIPNSFLGKVEDLDLKISKGGKDTNFSELISLDWRAKDGKVGKNVKFNGKVLIEENNSIIKDNSVISNL